MKVGAVLTDETMVKPRHNEICDLFGRINNDVPSGEGVRTLDEILSATAQVAVKIREVDAERAKLYRREGKRRYSG